jgi:hypothetical protein
MCRERGDTQMKITKMIGLAAMVTVVATSSASATTLEVQGITKNESIAIEASVSAESSTTFQYTNGQPFATCAGSELKTATESPYTRMPGPVGGKVSTLSFSGCTDTFEVISMGTLSIEHISGSTNGTVVSSGAEWRIGWPKKAIFCKTGKGTDLGTLTWGAPYPDGHATLDVNAVLDCGWIFGEAVMQGTYVITSPTVLGVVA